VFHFSTAFFQTKTELFSLFHQNCSNFPQFIKFPRGCGVIQESKLLFKSKFGLCWEKEVLFAVKLELSIITIFIAVFEGRQSTPKFDKKHLKQRYSISHQ